MTLTVDIKKKLHDYTLELKLEHTGGCLGILGPSGWDGCCQVFSHI